MSLGKLMAAARADAQKFATAGGFEVDINLGTADGLTIVDVQGLNTNHHQSIDNEGNSVNSTSRHISIPEGTLTALNYPVRNAKGTVALVGHKARVMDNTGVLRDYVVNECHPNGTTGLIVCILGLA